MNILKTISVFSFSLMALACTQKQSTKTITVYNDLNMKRSFETVELTQEILAVKHLKSINIKDVETGNLLVSQLVDTNNDGEMDVLLFQPEIGPNSKKKYALVNKSEKGQPKATDYCYSRFVPERTDDYAWENDKVAFRTFGPTAQKMIEDNIPGGTLTSGIDIWLKKVDYPIIDKWYKETLDGTGNYHEDTGEGVDNFHVGISRGVGGISVKQDSMFYFSKNFTYWKTITTGPIRTSFHLEYKDWDADGQMIKESKLISLDLGSHMSKIELTLEGSASIFAGLTLHENDGMVKADTNMGWLSYWQPHGDSELGTGIIADANTFVGSKTYTTEVQDLSNAYAELKVINNKATYYAGFGWKESGHFNNSDQWHRYLNEFSRKINSPLRVVLNK